MNYVSSIAFSLAVVLLATAGMAAIFGADRIRDGLLRTATGAIVVALGLPMLAGVLGHLACDNTPRIGGGTRVEQSDPLLLLAFVIGHVSLGILLLRRRAGAERNGFATDVEAARGRERVRLTPPIAREDVR